ncbi:hypothetical protein Ancab_011906 [Ancistrocladus abbreviatus]
MSLDETSADEHHHRADQSKPSSATKSSSVTLGFCRSSLRDSKDDVSKDTDGKDRREKGEGSLSSSENNNSTTESDQSSSTTQQTSQTTTRRLSVQDRINLFENKQKVITSSSSPTVSTGIGGGGSGGSGDKPVVVGKSVELRRLSSDVSSSTGFEKAVLRRWSGASDMSIDLSGEKELPDSNVSTPISVSAVSSSQAKQQQQQPPRVSLPLSSVVVSEDKDQKWSSDAVIASLAEPEIKRGSGDGRIKDRYDSRKEEIEFNKPVRTIIGAQVAVFSGGSEDSSSESRVATTASGRSKNVVEWKDQIMTWSKTSFGSAEEFGLGKQTTSQITQFRSLPRKDEQFGIKDQEALVEKVKVQYIGEEVDAIGKQVASCGRKGLIGQKNHFGFSGSRVRGGLSESEDCQVPQDEVEGVGGNQQAPTSHFRASQKTTVDVESDSEDRSKSVSLSKGVEVDPLGAQPKWKSFGGVDRLGRNNFDSSEKQLDRVPAEAEDSSSFKIKFQGHDSVSECVKKPQWRDDGDTASGGNQAGFTGDNTFENQELSTPAAPSADQGQRVRQSKGNQGLNDELKMKANELEKLFAKHKLRTPGDQLNLTRRSKPTDLRTEHEASSLNNKPSFEVSPARFTAARMVAEPSKGSNNINKFDSSPTGKSVDDGDYDATPKKNIYSLSFSDESRGKFYLKYMQKRDAKLREEWSLKKGEKEARMKAMQDSLERSRAELKTKLTGSADRQDSALQARRRAEKFRSFSARSATRRQQPIEAILSEEDEDKAEFSRLKPYGQDLISGETFLGDGSSRSAQSKKGSPNKSMGSSTPRTLAAPLNRSSVKTSNSSAGRRKMQLENPLAQSAPNLSELRKENTRPSSGGSKTTIRSQIRNYARSKSGNEEKSRQSQSLKKNHANPVELKDLSSHDSDAAVLTSLKYDTEDIEVDDEFSGNMVTKPSLRKGNAVSPVTGSGIAKTRSLLSMETLNNEDEEHMELAKEDEEDDFESMVGEDSANMDNGKPRLSQESEKSLNSGSENSDAVRCDSQADTGLAAELPATMPSSFRTIGSVQDSPGESPGSWNVRMRYPFSFSNEISDIDASVDSPIGSPAYWNSHPLAQAEAEAARMRKKWGAAQKPFVVTDSSHIQSRKDVTRGLKRFLKFGRKNRATESLADWISATTSEGDDDNEDGRDSANRSSEDLRKSRMGFSLGHASDDGFNEADFNERVQAFQSSIPTPPANFKLRDEHLSGSSLKAPRSFFSLSNFRSKGSDSKPR